MLPATIQKVRLICEGFRINQGQHGGQRQHPPDSSRGAGPEIITQLPEKIGYNYTLKPDVTIQEGVLWSIAQRHWPVLFFLWLF